MQNLRRSINEQGLDALLISQQQNCRYLSGFTGSSGWLLISDKRSILATDFRYMEQVKREIQDFEILQIKAGLPDWLPELASESGWHKLGFEAKHISVADYQQLAESIEAKQVDLELIATSDLVEQLRNIKDSQELDTIERAVELTDAAFKQAGTIIHPGITEKEAAWQIEKFLRQNGSEDMPFDIIVASGPNTALPHANPTERIIGRNEPVLIDMGARVDGYCSDFSRTFSLGRPDKIISEIYNITRDAQLAAIKGIKAGMKASEADKLARAVIEQAGYGDAFGHGLGHGVGLEIHEGPRLSPNSPDLLADGMVFTIEPGIYIPGVGGCRIEDTVVLEKGTVRVLTKSEKVMEVIV